MPNEHWIVPIIMAVLTAFGLLSKKCMDLYREVKKMKREEAALDKVEQWKQDSKESTFWQEQYEKWHTEVKSELKACKEEHAKCHEAHTKLSYRVGELEHLLGKVG